MSENQLTPPSDPITPDPAAAAPTEAFAEFDPQGTTGDPMGFASLLDVGVCVTVEVGRTQKTLAEIVELGPGDVVVLGRAAHEPADILVNGKVVARGEILTVGDTYGVRITSVETTPRSAA